MKDFPPNTNPELFSIIGSIVGLILEDDFNSFELNSLGNFIILVGQFMLTTAAQQQLINFRYQNNTGSNIRTHANSHHEKNTEKACKRDLDLVYQMIKKLEKEIEILKNGK